MILLIFQFLIIYQISNIYTITIPVETGKINNTKWVNVSSTNEIIIQYNYNRTKNNDGYLRARVGANLECNNSVLIILKDEDSEVTFLKLSNCHNNSSTPRNTTAERTICSLPNIFLIETYEERTLTVEISTKSSSNIAVKVDIEYLDNFQLQLDIPRQITIGYLSPKYFSYTFSKSDKSTDMVNVQVDSDNDVCMVLSVQLAECPVYDRPENVRFQSTYQTVTRSGSITISKGILPRFFAVFVLTLYECNRTFIPILSHGVPDWTTKSFTVTVTKVPNQREYILPILSVIGGYLAFYLVAYLISVTYKYKCHKEFAIEVIDTNHMFNNLDDPALGSADEVADLKTLYSRGNRDVYKRLDNESESSSNRSHNKSKSINDEDFDLVSDVFTDPNIFRLNKSLFVSDLSKKRSDVIDRKYFLYFWYLVIISVFYVLPVIQLVFIYQKALLTTGNEDMCYYNFRCARPLYIFTAFNNIISNIGYVLLGILFTLITWRRHRLYNECKFQCHHDKRHGIPQYYGVFYAMGLSLTMEGVLSACYHVCPSNTNFQFDTAYMYILACLCIIKIYQIRHPDVNASAHSFYMTIAFVIFAGVLGVVYNSHLFWKIFPIVYVAVFVFITAEIYYMGRWRLDFGLPRRLYLLIKNDKWMVLMPTYKARMVILVLLTIINLSIAIYGAITMQADFASYFLGIFMINLFLYFFFYIGMKIKYRENFHITSIIYVIIGVAIWAVALYCFINHPTEWQKTPSESRMENKKCILMDFYDIHDVWHLLSSMAMFFSFLGLQNLDDGLFTVSRDEIVVF